MKSITKRACAIMLAIVTVITMSAFSSVQPVNAATENVKEVHLQAWYKALKDATAYYNGGNPKGIVFKYNKDWDESKGQTNCAGFVSRAMRNMGWLSSGKKIWLSTTVNGSGKNEIPKNFNVTYPKKVPSKAKLQPGDICGFQWGDTKDNKVHTMVYAGTNKSGYPIWYSFGSATKEWKTGPGRHSSYETKNVQVLLRYKNLRTSDYVIKTSALNGTITAKTTVAYGKNASISYAPNEGFVLSDVKVDGESVDITQYPETYAFKAVTADHNIRTEFEWENASELPEEYHAAVPMKGLIKGITDGKPYKSPNVTPTQTMVGTYTVLLRKDGQDVLRIDSADAKVKLGKSMKSASLSDGEYVVYLVGTVSDEEGNETLVAERKTFIYDTTAPEVTLDAENGKVFADSGSVAYSVKLKDSDILPEEKYNKITATATINGKDATIKGNAVTLSKVGTYAIEFHVKDYVGNETVKKVSVKVAKTPTVTYSGPKNKSKAKKPAKITANTNVKGKMTMKVYLDSKLIKTITGDNTVTFNSYGNKGKYVFKTFCTSTDGIKSETVRWVVYKI